VAVRRTVDPVDDRTDIRDVLTSRRARVTPEQAGLLPGSPATHVAAAPDPAHSATDTI
jgi:hypothetical protein